MKSKAQPRKERLFSSSQNSLRQSGEAPVARRRHWEQTSQTQGLRVPCPASRGRKAKRIFWFICKQAQTLQRLSIPACANPGVPEPGRCPYGAAVPTLPSARGTTFLPDGGGGRGRAAGSTCPGCLSHWGATSRTEPTEGCIVVQIYTGFFQELHVLCGTCAGVRV